MGAHNRMVDLNRMIRGLWIPNTRATPTATGPVTEPLNPCSICLQEMKDRTTTDNCSHDFCFDCIIRWIKENSICPLCKVPILKLRHNIGEGPETGDVIAVSLLRVGPYPTSFTNLQAFRETEHAIREQFLLNLDSFPEPNNLAEMIVPRAQEENEDYNESP